MAKIIKLHGYDLSLFKYTYLLHKTSLSYDIGLPNISLLVLTCDKWNSLSYDIGLLNISLLKLDVG